MYLQIVWPGKWVSNWIKHVPICVQTGCIRRKIESNWVKWEGKPQKGLFYVAEPDRSYRMVEHYVCLHYRVLCGQWSGPCVLTAASPQNKHSMYKWYFLCQTCTCTSTFRFITMNCATSNNINTSIQEHLHVLSVAGGNCLWLGNHWKTCGVHSESADQLIALLIKVKDAHTVSVERTQVSILDKTLFWKVTHLRSHD